MTPDEHTIKEFYLDVGNGHELYVQEWGNPKAKVPVIFLHGGPGANCHDGHKQLFDPKERVIFFDQRGAGRSLPKGSLEHNTTDDLVEDIERLADHLKLKQFVLVGGSWGSTLAFVYTLKHPKRVKAMALRGIFTATQSECDFIDDGGNKDFYPDVWDAYLSRTPKKHHEDPSAYHYKQMQSDNPDLAKASAYAYAELESSLLKLDDRHKPGDFDEFDPTSMFLYAHYVRNKFFLPEGYILKNAQKLTIPIWIIQGRYDMVCPPMTAYKLNKILPNSNLVWTLAGHHGGERESYSTTRSIVLQLTPED